MLSENVHPNKFILIPRMKTMKGGNEITLRNNCPPVTFPLEYILAMIMPTVDKATNVPGRSTIIKVFKPSSPYRACMTGMPTKDVLPKPAVMIKHPVRAFDQPKYFPKK